MSCVYLAMWDNFKTHARDAQLVLRNTGQLTVRESMNHAEVVNLVSEGVRQALAENTVPVNEEFDMGPSPCTRW